jgi:hypothetical protein
MMKTISALSLSLVCVIAAYAQHAETRSTGQVDSQTSAATSHAGKSINLTSGTRLSGELQNTIDARRAKVGDQVVLKTTQAIKSGGHTVVNKGARLVGHVTEVTQNSKGNGESRIGILFDRLERGSLEVPISATISSITNARGSGRANKDDLFGSDSSAHGSARSNASASSSRGSSNLLGGVVNSTTSTVDNVVGGTTSAVGTTVNSTTGSVGNTATGLGRSLGRIQISESSNASVEGSSVLSLQGGNLRLEKGTNFNLVLNQSATAGAGKDQ